MSSEGEILPGSSIAAVYMRSGLRVYFQDVDGYVRESRWETITWQGGSYKDILFRAKIGTPLAATSWSDSKIRIYYLDRGGNLQEHCWDGGEWYNGNFGSTPKLMHCPHTRLAVTSYNNDGLYIRVYYQTTTGTIQEHCYDSDLGWYTGAPFPVALPESSIAVVAEPLRVYFQDCDGWVREYICNDGPGWREGSLTFEVPHRTPLVAVSWTGCHGFQMRLHYRSFSNHIVEVCFWGDTWQQPTIRIVPCMSNSQFAVAQVPDGADKASRIYYQKDMGQLYEHAWSSVSWVAHSVVPTGTTL
ncbi:fucose-specific lectin [Wilcoxina mikolae CBS 423.85]|nr:fucose-specific lectin [Wilcoxina mikolae CBS 423.85]